MAGEFTREEFETWVTAQEAFETLARDTGSGPIAVRKLLPQLLADLLHARAETAYAEKGDTRGKPINFCVVPREVWKRLSESQYVASDTMWQTNNYTFIKLSEHRGYGLSTEIHYLGIRFEPTEFRKLLRHRTVPVLEEQHPRIEAPPTITKPTGKPPAPAHLQAWADLFLKVYPEDQVSEDLALESAKGMFQEKFVSRESVRKLLPPRKRGRKPTLKDQ
jgi:hypothetical protein